MDSQSRLDREEPLHTNQTTNTIMNDLGSSDAQFFKVLQDNMRYVFHSPIQTKTQFPTPYSSNQLDSSQNNNDPIMLANTNNNDRNDTSFHRNPDSSFIDRTLNPQLYPSNSNNNKSNNKNNNNNNNNNQSDGLQDMNIQPSSALQFSDVDSNITKKETKKLNSRQTRSINNNNNNNNNNLMVPNSNNNSNNIQTDFLLPSPVQLREFLYDSPAGINFFHNTPARSPLKFFNDGNMNTNTNNNNGPSSSNLMHLFNSVNNNNNNNTNTNDPENNPNSINDLWDRISMATRTPLRKIDINLMFNNGQLLTNPSESMSPLKRLSMSLTPYGRRILNDMGTPFHNIGNNNNNNNIMITSSGIKSTNNNNNTHAGSSNSALIDFQRARKDTTLGGPLGTRNDKIPIAPTISPPRNGSNSLDITTTSPKLVITPKKSKDNLKNLNNIDQIPKLTKTDNKNKHLNRNIDSRLIGEENDDMGFDGSSPTTIQLNSSVTKSVPKLSRGESNKLGNKIPVLSRNMSLMEKTSLDVTLSPTPNSNGGNLSPSLGNKRKIYTNMNNSRNNNMSHNSLNRNNNNNNTTPMNNNNNNKLTFLPIPDLPKMGSFKSERTTSNLTNSDLSMNTTTSTIPSRLPSISTFPSTTILLPQTQQTHQQGKKTTTTSTTIKKSSKNKKKVTKVKKPKFQIFVSSVHKFSDPNSSIPLSSLKSGNSHPDKILHKANKRGKK